MVSPPMETQKTNEYSIAIIQNKFNYMNDKKYNENIFKRIVNSILIGALIGISHLPFWILFGISDFLYILLRHVVKYRFKVISENLTNAFPEKTEAEIKTITNRFYHHFCDIFIETIKSYSISSDEMNKRMNYKNIEILNDHFDKGNSVILLGMHYNNWEWNSAMPLTSKHKILVIYNPIRGNKAFEDFILKIRTRWGCNLIPVHKSRRIVFDIAKAKTPIALALGADQTAPANSKFWTTFLNREAPFFSGPEKIANHSNFPVFLHHTRKIKRGMYEVEYIPLFENPKEVEPAEILLTYIRKLEELIAEEPAYYLWSHRRWKHKRPANIPLQ